MPCECEGTKCPSCPNNPLCKEYIPGRNSKWYRCGALELRGICEIPKSQCPACQHYKEPGLVGRPRKDEFFNPALDDPRVYGETIDPNDAKRRYMDKVKGTDEFKTQRAAYMRQYRRERASGGLPKT